jgi:hypothetical protein
MKQTHHTDSGMLCIWDYECFKHIHDYDSWDQELCEDKDISRNISKSNFIPLNLGDGAFEVEVRFDKAKQLTDREKEYLLVPSHPYLLKTKGKVCLSGIEHVSGDITQNVTKFDLKPGEYIVQINLIDWNQEPDAVDPDGSPTDLALPDMIVFISEYDQTEMEFRTEIETFRKEDALR